nr:hypothetical protein CFP56_10954 [Quercus suber]POF00898.1 hypothetical protein CFP56_20846 [Quercus suber]
MCCSEGNDQTLVQYAVAGIDWLSGRRSGNDPENLYHLVSIRSVASAAEDTTMQAVTFLRLALLFGVVLLQGGRTRSTATTAGSHQPSSVRSAAWERGTRHRTSFLPYPTDFHDRIPRSHEYQYHVLTSELTAVYTVICAVCGLFSPIAVKGAAKA